VGARDPALWTLHLNAEKAPAAGELFRRGGTLELSDWIRDAGDREETLACVPLVLRRGEQRMLVPDDDFDVRLGDEILMCSTRAAQAQIKTNLVNVYTLEYLVTGTAPTRGYVMSWLVGAVRTGRLRPDPSASSASRPDV
jgi:hypothetical protein